ncbi:MAG: transporter, family, hexuronate transporter [Blastocatellia bacterium]|jgi:ACS family hexuronate transporter-like MFS transporter|nr:transporter, family, hexuronate transporter [Blastocatellia bacterium]
MLDTQPIEASTSEAGFKLRGLRWWIVGLIFLATLINYIDRLTISVLAPVITRDLGLTNTQFGGIITWFLLAYTISQSLSGKLYDRVGTKRGFVCSIVLWSFAAMAHAFARGLSSLSALRFILGLGEAGNWPGAAKTVAEWFPIRERAFGMAIFNSGAAIGSVVSPPLIVWLSLTYGWQKTFIVTGSLGFAWLALWLLFYQTPDRHKWLGERERRLIREGQRADGATDPLVAAEAAPLGWRELLRYRQVWAIVLARFLTDPIWWLYISWLPKYLADARGFSLVKIGLFAWVPYVAADAGSLSGGWLSGYLIGRGWSVDRARKVVIAIAALLMPAGIFAAFARDAMVALALIGVVLFGFQVWINNVQTLPSDFFSDKAVASVAGLGGTGAGIGSMIFIFGTGWAVDHFSYVPVLVTAGLLAPLGTLVLFALSGRIERVSLKPSLRFAAG